MNSLSKKLAAKMLEREITALEVVFDRMQDFMPHRGRATWLIPVEYTLCPKYTPLHQVRNSVNRLRARAQIIANLYPQLSMYVEAELWVLDAIDGAVALLLNNARETMSVSEFLLT